MATRRIIGGLLLRRRQPDRPKTLGCPLKAASPPVPVLPKPIDALSMISIAFGLSGHHVALSDPGPLFDLTSADPCESSSVELSCSANLISSKEVMTLRRVRSSPDNGALPGLSTSIACIPASRAASTSLTLSLRNKTSAGDICVELARTMMIVEQSGDFGWGRDSRQSRALPAIHLLSSCSSSRPFLAQHS